MTKDQQQKTLMAKNLKATGMDADIVACKACLQRGRPVRFIVPMEQLQEGMQCTWCGKKISKYTIGKNMERIGRVEKGVARYYNDEKKLVVFDKLTNPEKSRIGLTPTGQQKDRRVRY